MQVDLPQPVGPTRNTNSPRPIRIETPSSAHGTAVVDLGDVLELDDRHVGATGLPARRGVRRFGVNGIHPTRILSEKPCVETPVQPSCVHLANTCWLSRGSCTLRAAREEVSAALGERHQLELRGLDELPSGHDRERRGAAQRPSGRA